MEIYMWVCPKCGNAGAGGAEDLCPRCGCSVILTDISYDKYTYEFDNVQRQEWDKEVIEKYVKYNPQFSEEALDKRLIAEYREKNAQQYKPKCPICQSTSLSKITTASKVAKVAMLGIFGMGDNGKTWKCNSCGSRF